MILPAQCAKPQSKLGDSARVNELLSRRQNHRQSQNLRSLFSAVHASFRPSKQIQLAKRLKAACQRSKKQQGPVIKR